ncbi:hypothetical protein CIK05_01830 [Bdellovibrio sp. qaytius]|nr:hypothetical protein CIK05_01830 [Bdellovibrio sp. qaytius]
MNKAVVIGGGIAGLAAARVLADHFSSVVVCDKDPHIGSAQVRVGAPQGSHLHVLLKNGQSVLQELMPEVFDKVSTSQCPTIDWAQDTVWENKFGRFPRYASDEKTFAFSRGLLESEVFKSVSQYKNISFKYGQVLEFKTFESQIKNITLISGEIIEADLFVFAGGAQAKLPALLGLLQSQIPYDVTDIDVTYYSARFKTETVSLPDCAQYYYQADPHLESIGGVISPIENGLTVATLIEYGKTPVRLLDRAAFLAKSMQLPKLDFFSAVMKAEMQGQVSCFHKKTMSRVRPSAFKHLPSNLILVGDALLSLNPVFGQGMTSAFLQIRELNTQLKKNKNINAIQFHKKALSLTNTAFAMSKAGSMDQRHYVKRYLDGYLQLAGKSQAHHLRFLQALHLERGPLSLFDAGVAIKAMRPQ